jgi:hypothetical protein
VFGQERQAILARIYTRKPAASSQQNVKCA